MPAANDVLSRIRQAPHSIRRLGNSCARAGAQGTLKTAPGGEAQEGLTHSHLGRAAPVAGPAGRPAPPTLRSSCGGREIEHPVPLTPWKASLHVPGLGLREHSKPPRGARRKRVLRIAISAGRRRWPVPPVGPPLPRSEAAAVAARSSIQCRSRPGKHHFMCQGWGSGNTQNRSWGRGARGSYA